MNLADKIQVLKAPSFSPLVLFKTSLIGGEGVLYKLQESKDLIAKIFIKQETAKKKESKINAMIESFIANKANSEWSNLFNSFLAMPRARLYDNNREFVGFLMNFIDQTNSIRIDKFIEDEFREYSNEKSIKVKFIVALNIAKLVNDVHKLGFVVGDLNDKNIFIRRSNGKPILIDCDSFQFKSFKMNAIQPSIKPPEIGKMELYDVRTDSFVLAILIYKILMMAYSPFQYKGNNPNDDINAIIAKGDTPLRNSRLELPDGCPKIELLGPGLKKCLGDCLDPNYKNRPYLDELINVLQIRLDELSK